MSRRMVHVAVAYGVAAVVFALLGVFGLQALASGAWAFGVSWVIAGSAGVAGSLAIFTAALSARRAVAGDRSTMVALSLPMIVARIGRGIVLLGAVGTGLAGVLLAPPADDEDRPLVLGVSIVLAVALAFLALVADDVGRAVDRYHRNWR